jgi:hypothetical protein
VFLETFSRPDLRGEDVDQAELVETRLAEQEGERFDGLRVGGGEVELNELGKEGEPDLYRWGHRMIRSVEFRLIGAGLDHDRLTIFNDSIPPKTLQTLSGSETFGDEACGGVSQFLSGKGVPFGDAVIRRTIGDRDQTVDR